MEIRIVLTKDIPSGKIMGIEAQGQKILVANVAGQYYAIGNICTHEGCTLSDGTLAGETIHCPCHGSTFNVRTAAVVRGPARIAEQSFKLKADGGQILLIT